MGTTLLVLVLVGGSLLFAAAIVFSILGLIRILHRTNGFGRLRQCFATQGPPAGPVVSGQTIKVGVVQYRRCASVAAEPESLYLRIDSRLVGYPAVRVPWQEVVAVEPITVLLRQALRLTIGRTEPITVILLGPAVTLLQPHLEAARQGQPHPPMARPMSRHESVQQ